MMKKRLHLIVQGRVHGVCYRMYTCQEAVRLGLTGWVRNKADGTVEVVAEGEDNMLADLAAWCRCGPPHARVSGVIQKYSDATGEFDEFVISC